MSAKAKSITFVLLMLAAICLFIALIVGCADTRWNASYERPIDFHQPVGEIPGQFRAGIGGAF